MGKIRDVVVSVGAALVALPLLLLSAVLLGVSWLARRASDGFAYLAAWVMRLEGGL